MRLTKVLTLKQAASPNFGSENWWENTPSAPPTQEFWNDWQRILGLEMARLAADYAAGRINLDDWTQAVFRVIEDGHGLAWMLGRQRAGDLTPWSEADRTTGIIASQFDAPFLLRFKNQLDAGDPRYIDIESGEIDAEAIGKRSALYTQRMRGTAGWAWEQSLPTQAEIRWVMTKLEHCPDCPELAAEGPYFPGELVTVPGEGMTACFMNCGCHLETTDFLPSFERS